MSLLIFPLLFKCNRDSMSFPPRPYIFSLVPSWPWAWLHLLSLFPCFFVLECSNSSNSKVPSHRISRVLLAFLLCDSPSTFWPQILCTCYSVSLYVPRYSWATPSMPSAICLSSNLEKTPLIALSEISPQSLCFPSTLLLHQSNYLFDYYPLSWLECN